MSEKIININQSKDKFCGIIKTTKRTISYRFEGNICCNDCGVEETWPLNNFIGKCITEMDLVEVLEERDDEDCGGKGCFSIMCGDDIYTLTFSNYHNGYYVMNFDVEIGGKPYWNVAL